MWLFKSSSSCFRKNVPTVFDGDVIDDRREEAFELEVTLLSNVTVGERLAAVNAEARGVAVTFCVPSTLFRLNATGRDDFALLFEADEEGRFIVAGVEAIADFAVVFFK